MKDCTHCKHADWDMTKAGRLHPSGEGRCTFPVKILPLPASMFWRNESPYPRHGGGLINRNVELTDHCVYFARKVAT